MGQTQIHGWSVKRSKLFTVTRQAALLNCASGCEVACADCLVMAALRSRCGHYIFALWFLLLLLLLLRLLLLLLFFFPCLISAVAEWMSTILPHIVWP